MLPLKVAEVLFSWRGVRHCRSRKKACFFAPLAVLWFVWAEHNREALTEITPISKLTGKVLSLCQLEETLESTVTYVHV